MRGVREIDDVQKLYCARGVLADNKKVYFAPHDALRVLYIDPETDHVEQIGPEHEGDGMRQSCHVAACVLALNGEIYAAPAEGVAQILRICPEYSAGDGRSAGELGILVGASPLAGSGGSSSSGGGASRGNLSADTQTVESPVDEPRAASSRGATEGERGQRGLGRTASGCEDGDGPGKATRVGRFTPELSDEDACLMMCEASDPDSVRLLTYRSLAGRKIPLWVPSNARIGYVMEEVRRGLGGEMFLGEVQLASSDGEILAPDFAVRDLRSEH